MELFVEVGREVEDSGGEVLRSVNDLQPRDYDQILYQLGNEGQHAFMLPMIVGLGGTVMLHDWVLFDLAMAAFGSLRRGGLLGMQRAFREGGSEEAKVYLQSRRRPVTPSRGERLRLGWYPYEEGGCWSAAHAELAFPECEQVRLELWLPKGRRLQLSQGRRRLGKWTGPDEGVLDLELEAASDAPVTIDVRGAGPSRGSKGATDLRELGVFLRSAEVRNSGDWSPVDLDEVGPPAVQGLSDDRFRLSLNRSVVRHADAFLVHSDSVGEKILSSRNAPTPISRVHHGVERRWDQNSTAGRESVLPESWSDSFVLASFGALQAHKRPGVLIDALQLLHEQGLNVRLLCVGEERGTEYDFSGELERRGLDSFVRLTGWLPEQDAWDALRAADLCINLRGPSTGGTSGGASQALSLGKPVIVSDLPEFAHLPESCVVRVPHGKDEARDIARIVRDLHESPARLAEMGAAARRAVDEELHWSHVAKRYLEVFESFPRARASRRSLFVRFLHSTRKAELAPKPD